MSEITDAVLFGDKSDRLKMALKLYDKSISDLDQDINILKEWIKSQPHLPEIPGKFMIEKDLLFNTHFPLSTPRSSYQDFFITLLIVAVFF